MGYAKDGLILASNETINGFILWYKVEWPKLESNLTTWSGDPDFEAHVKIIDTRSKEEVMLTIDHRLNSRLRKTPPYETFRRAYRAWNTKVFKGIRAILNSSIEDIPIYINEPHPYSNVALWRLNLPKTLSS